MTETFLSIGSAPGSEPCAQVGTDDYPERSAIECRLFMADIIAALGAPPDGAELVVKSFPHDFGSYREVVCWYRDEAAIEYAFKCEADAPSEWSDRAKTVLALPLADQREASIRYWREMLAAKLTR